MSGRANHADERAFPQAMHAARHKVVHQVITRRNIAEDAVNQTLFFGERHARIAEMRLFACRKIVLGHLTPASI